MILSGIAGSTVARFKEVEMASLIVSVKGRWDGGSFRLVCREIGRVDGGLDSAFGARERVSGGAGLVECHREASKDPEKFFRMTRRLIEEESLFESEET